MKNLKLNDLKLTSFIAELSEEQTNKVTGGTLTETAAATYTGATSCCNPGTTESNVDTCGNPAPAKCIKTIKK